MFRGFPAAANSKVWPTESAANGIRTKQKYTCATNNSVPFVPVEYRATFRPFQSIMFTQRYQNHIINTTPRRASFRMAWAWRSGLVYPTPPYAPQISHTHTQTPEAYSEQPTGPGLVQVCPRHSILLLQIK